MSWVEWLRMSVTKLLSTLPQTWQTAQEDCPCLKDCPCADPRPARRIPRQIRSFVDGFIIRFWWRQTSTSPATSESPGWRATWQAQTTHLDFVRGGVSSRVRSLSSLSIAKRGCICHDFSQESLSSRLWPRRSTPTALCPNKEVPPGSAMRRISHCSLRILTACDTRLFPKVQPLLRAEPYPAFVHTDRHRDALIESRAIWIDRLVYQRGTAPWLEAGPLSAPARAELCGDACTPYRTG